MLTRLDATLREHHSSGTNQTDQRLKVEYLQMMTRRKLLLCCQPQLGTPHRPHRRGRKKKRKPQNPLLFQPLSARWVEDRSKGLCAEVPPVIRSIQFRYASAGRLLSSGFSPDFHITDQKTKRRTMRAHDAQRIQVIIRP